MKIGSKNPSTSIDLQIKLINYAVKLFLTKIKVPEKYDRISLNDQAHGRPCRFNSLHSVFRPRVKYSNIMKTSEIFDRCGDVIRICLSNHRPPHPPVLSWQWQLMLSLVQCWVSVNGRWMKSACDCMYSPVLWVYRLENLVVFVVMSSTKGILCCQWLKHSGSW